MINILNGYDFQRNSENVVTYKISSLSTILGLKSHEVKEHYFHCIIDQCFGEGEFHYEEVVAGEIEVHLPPYNLKALIDSLKREGLMLMSSNLKVLLIACLKHSALFLSAST